MMEPEAFQEQIVAYLRGDLGVEEREEFEAMLARSRTAREELEQTRDLLDALAAASDESAARTAREILKEAAQRGAVEIHIVPGQERGRVLFRTGSGLQEMMRLPPDTLQPIVDRLKRLSDCGVTERRAAQGGWFTFEHGGYAYNVNVSLLPTLQGERATARLEFRGAPPPDLASIGFSPGQIEGLRDLLSRPQGLLLVAAPVGGGQREALYALLGEARAREVQPSVILTVEEEVERVLDGVCQVTVDPARGLTFAEALRAALRSNPEMLLVTDLPDRETARLALRGAVEGRRVLAGLVARGAAGGIRQLCDLSGDAGLVAQALVGVVGLRRVRHTCSGCATEYRPAPELLRLAALSWSEDGPFRHGAGCEACRESGYQGSTHLVELLSIEDVLGPLIAGDLPEAELRTALVRRPVPTLWDDAREKIRGGVTTVEEARRALLDEPPPQLGAGCPLQPIEI
jgi:type II secretory ATPase GspE/PulE/Tfp pilus assembly ATPase PilB-like protein